MKRFISAVFGHVTYNEQRTLTAHDSVYRENNGSQTVFLDNVSYELLKLITSTVSRISKIGLKIRLTSHRLLFISFFSFLSVDLA